MGHLERYQQVAAAENLYYNSKKKISRKAARAGRVKALYQCGYAEAGEAVDAGDEEPKLAGRSPHYWAPDDAPQTQIWKADYQLVLETLQSRKRSNFGGRLLALETYGRLLSTTYVGPVIAATLGDVTGQLVRSVHCSNANQYEEKHMAMKSLAITVLSCATPTDAGLVYEESISLLKSLVTASDVDSATRVLAIRTMAIVGVCGSGLMATLEGLLDLLLEIVESDGHSVYAPDDANVVNAAIEAWAFVVSFIVDAFEDGDVVTHAACAGESEFLQGENYLVAEGQRALDAFVDQLDSAEPSVQIQAGNAIALLYEASRFSAAVLGVPLGLQKSPYQIADQIERELMPGTTGSVKSTKRQRRQEMRADFRNIVNSLERGVGPDFRTSYADGDDDTVLHKMDIIVGDYIMPVDTWCKKTRIDLLRFFLGQWLGVHLQGNPLVRHIVDTDRLVETPFSLYRKKEKDRKTRGCYEYE